ncbi:DUF1365 domain-containing protein [Henriciella sp. AS95]|uniref:DUF1365 domain-containing protein n=1 Tax=Henriciella sp. AS95 TaxID=3135782 RepID=UPI003179EA5B
MNMPPALKLHYGHTSHKRFAPFQSGFRYGVFMIDVDVDRLDEAEDQCKRFSINKSNLFSLRTAEHGSCGRQSLRAWAEAEFEKADIDAAEHQIRLITFPRHLNYKFAPISLWVAYFEGAPTGIIYEVRNTFGERHNYVAALDGKWSRHNASKQFHVSPFFDVDGTYQFSFQLADDELRLGITTIKDETPVHMASLATKAVDATDLRLWKAAIARPVSTFGVTFAIHWQAFKLWIRGAKYRPKPQGPQHSTTVAKANGESGNRRAA